MCFYILLLSPCEQVKVLCLHKFLVITEKLFTSKILIVSGQKIFTYGSKCSEAFPSFLFSSIYSVRYSNKVCSFLRKFKVSQIIYNFYFYAANR